ncbi:MAG TPA: helix-turn-helix domain-containing protein [Candidatus Paceibacterota bacterium]|jgi:sugar-specific transcriptional regulator TrmB|nr:helix-turn-helix domain-containing protein [Candidatus Paceibacterota bacterium]
METNSGLLQTLEHAGLTDKEARVYLALLSLGTATAYRIAEHCSVKKPTVYITLEDLRKKGLVLKVPHAKKALFAPRDIAEYLHERESELESVRRAVPQLHALGAQAQSNVFFFSGLAGIKQAAEHKYSQMKGKTFYSFYSALTGADTQLLRFYNHWNKQALEDGIKFDVIMPKSAGASSNDIIGLADADKNVRIRYVLYKYPPKQSLEVGDDFVRITNEEEAHSTIIDDKATADAMRSIFEIVWAKDL